jgi:hypothetical protein
MAHRCGSRPSQTHTVRCRCERLVYQDLYQVKKPAHVAACER